MEIFWRTIAAYNSSTWIYQLAIILIGISLTVLLIRNPQSWLKLSMKIYLIAIHLWVAIIYYHIYCSERRFNDVLTLFWGIMALIWIWDMITGYTTFKRNYKYDVLGYLFLAMPFLYPLYSMSRGLVFPGITSPVMPCSVAVFSIGLLLIFSEKINMLIILFLCHWSLIGISKTYFFNIPEDFMLASASLPALILFFKEYFANNLHKDTKPKAKLINLFFIVICLAIGLSLTITLLVELKK